MKNNRIIRNIDGNKLVIDCDVMNYKIRMLESNRIQGLLPLEVTESDGIKRLCYDITSRDAFGELGTTRTLKMEDVRNLLYSLNHILKNIEKYLLVPDELVLDKNYIYVQSTSLDPRLCYLPGYSVGFASGLSTLLQDVLGMVDHNDHDAVVLAYSLYQESLKPGYVMADLIRILNSNNSVSRDIMASEENGSGDGDRWKRNRMGTTDREWDGQDRGNYETDNGEKSRSLAADRIEKTTDELFIQYQMPAMQHLGGAAGRAFAKTSGRTSDRTSGKATDKLYDKASDKSYDRATDKSYDRATDKSYDRTSDKSYDRASDKSSDKTSGKSSGKTSKEDTDAMFSAMNKPSKRKRGMIFSW